MELANPFATFHLQLCLWGGAEAIWYYLGRALCHLAMSAGIIRACHRCPDLHSCGCFRHGRCPQRHLRCLGSYPRCCWWVAVVVVAVEATLLALRVSKCDLNVCSVCSIFTVFKSFFRRYRNVKHHKVISNIVRPVRSSSDGTISQKGSWKENTFSLWLHWLVGAWTSGLKSDCVAFSPRRECELNSVSIALAISKPIDNLVKWFEDCSTEDFWSK